MRLEECSQEVGVSRRSIYNWLNDDDFNKRLRERESEKIKRLNTRLIMASNRALEVLLEGLESRDESIRIRSASIIKSDLLKAIEIYDLYDRIEDLEVKYKNINKGSGS